MAQGFSLVIKVTTDPIAASLPHIFSLLNMLDSILGVVKESGNVSLRGFEDIENNGGKYGYVL